MTVTFRELTLSDYDAVLALWQSVEGVGLSDADSREAIGRYLARNPGCSFTAWDGDLLAGAVLCGHDGRRGYIHHLTVRESHRRQGLGKALATRCLAALAAEGIDKCHLFVFAVNANAIAFWKSVGWTPRVDLNVMSRYTGDGKR
ncbi:MAG TPA: GNAT family N-acetyltransferase [Anaerolineae bacterium]|nr:GNAT family N-acetyltransferase [Anaerolineae bacterium]